MDSLTEIEDVFTLVKPKTGIFLDVDETLITPRSLMFRTQGRPDFIDKIKKRSSEISNFIEILSHWRLKRRVMLVDKKWPRFCEQNLKF